MDTLKEYIFCLGYYINKKLEGNFTPILESDNNIHNLTVPVATRVPRITSGSASSVLNTIVCDTYDDFENGVEKPLINAASYHYGGYGTLEYDSVDVLKYAMNRLPFMSKNGEDTLIDTVVRTEFSRFMGYKNCIFTSTGYGMNMTVFPAMKEAFGDPTFILDGDCHNSMIMGARSCKSKYKKFKHNDVKDLERIVKTIEGPIVVCVESIYSMSGSITPLPDIIALKKKYGFKIYVDEAHSLFSLGRTGRGILEYYGATDVDVLGFTLSKSMGAIGGAILSNVNLNGEDELPTIVKVRLLQVIRKSNLRELRMKNLSELSCYIHDRLSESGLYIKNVRGSPIITICVGTYRNLSLFANTAQKEGLAVTAAGSPATPKGEGVIRLCISGIHTGEQAIFIVDKILELSARFNVRGYKYVQSSRDIYLEDLDMRFESDNVDNEIISLIYRCGTFRVPYHNKITLDKYGLGACSARWFYGTFDIHLMAEKKLARLYSNDWHGMVYSDTRNAVIFTIEALIEPLKNKRLKHLVFLDDNIPKSVLNMAKHDKNRIVMELEDIVSLDHIEDDYYSTLYIHDSSSMENVYDIMSKYKKCKGITLIVRDNKFGKDIRILERKNLRTVVFGTFEDIGIPGGYAVSDKNTTEILRWRSRGYFFTASPMPICMSILSDYLNGRASRDI